MIPRYTLPEMGAVWSEQARFERMLEVELAVCRAQVRRGLVPGGALEAIEGRARVDVRRIAEIERTTDHDVIAFVSQVAETVGPEGRYLHLGLTSSDVVDTALALQLRAAGERLLDDADRLIAALVARARIEAGTVMMGRTHSVHAEPTTFGLKCAGWAFEVARGRARLAEATAEIATGKISGPVGTYSHLGAGHRGGGPRRARAARGPGEHPDRPARPARGVPRGHRDPRRHARAARDRGPQPPAHRDRRGHGAVPAGPEGQLGDAPQAQPDPVRADRRARAPAARVRPDRRSRTSRCGTSATSATAPRSGWRCPTPRSCSTTCSSGRPAWSRGWSSGRSGCARTSSAASASTPRRGCCSRSSSVAGCRARTPTPSSSGCRCAPRTSACRCATCSRRTRRSPASCRWRSSTPASTTTALLRHVPEVIARLDALEAGRMRRCR